MLSINHIISLSSPTHIPRLPSDSVARLGPAVEAFPLPWATTCPGAPHGVSTKGIQKHCKHVGNTKGCKGLVKDYVRILRELPSWA